MLRTLKVCLFVSFLISFAGISHAQDSEFVFSGTLKDAVSKQAIPYATIVVFSKETKKVLNGTTTSEDGTFVVKSVSQAVYLELSFMGYEKKVMDAFEFKNNTVDFGDILLAQNSQTLNEVSVVAEKSTVEFKLDKRVFNVGKDISSTGMGAMEVLNNVPSVNVDIEGSVTLRGNAGVQILINGKPSVLADEQSNALGSITADMIESVEVITNPSAKYEAEGSSGIINIILKKEDKKGFNGSISMNTGLPNNHSLGGSVNYRTEKFNFFSQFGAGYRTQPRYSISENLNRVNNTQVVSDGTNYRNENFYNFTLGTDYYINDFNTITLSGNFAYEIETQPSTTDFTLYDSLGDVSSAYQRKEVTDATNPKYKYDLQYKKQFENNKDHVLLFSTLGSFFGKDLSSEFNNTFSTGESTSQQLTRTDFYQSDFTFKLDYTNPLSEKVTIESGALYEINDVGNDYAVFDVVGGQEVIDSNLANNFEYNQKVLGVYSTGSYEGQKWGVKLGFRLENTDLNTLLSNTNEENKQNYTNFFPSLHTSFKVSKMTSLQAGYSKRIFRPRMWDLNPFFNISNNYNIRRGNPELLPEYADSYEITGIFLMKKLSLNASIYHLYTTNVMERVSIFENDVNITSPINVGSNKKTGLEINGKYNANKWLTITGDFNYGYFVREGEYLSQNFDFSGNQWSMKYTGKFKLPNDYDFEVSPNYRSSVKTVQGQVSGFAFADVGIRKKIWKGKAVVNFSVRDVFASRIRENVVDQDDFYLYSFQKRGRFITLGFSYSFGKGEAMTYTGGGRR
jgi:outer membrane receptor protein involved in Fe transport